MTVTSLHPAADTALLFTSPPWQMPPGSPLSPDTLLEPLIERSLLQRAFERLLRLGARHVIVVLGERASEVREFLKAGERWGCRVTYQYPDPQASMRRFLQAIGVSTLRYYHVGNAWCIPDVAVDNGEPVRGAGITQHWSDSGTVRWTGWGCVAGSWLLSRELAVDCASLAANILDDEWLEKRIVTPTVVADTPANLIAGMERLLTLESLPEHRSSSARINSTARLIAPYHIGKSVKIDENAVVGPYAVIEDGAHIASRAQIRHSIVMPDTYVGEDLALDQVVANGPDLVNAALNSYTKVSDPELLSHLRAKRKTAHLGTRVSSAALRVMLLPLYWVLSRKAAVPTKMSETAVIPIPARYRSGMDSVRIAVSLPQRASASVPFDWSHHFVATFYPGLAAVGRGELRFVGPSLRSWHEVSTFPETWRQVYESSCCGLLNDTWLNPSPDVSSDHAFAADAFAAATIDSPGLPLRHILPYLRHVCSYAFGGGDTKPSPLTRTTPV